MNRYRLPLDSGELQLQVGSASHVGMVRSVNEDAVLAEPPVFAVADGMGGHAFGDRASATAVRALREVFDLEAPTDAERVLAAIRAANAAVRELTAGAADSRQIAGTTLAGVALVVEHPGGQPHWMVFNLGDSRVYLWNAAGSGGSARLERVSVDHSVVQELLDAGMIDEAAARVHPERNVITRALGAGDEVRTEAWLLPATEPVTFLICSDGLTKELDDARIAELLGPIRAEEAPDAAVDRLLAAALAAGGADNVSIVLVRAEYRGVDEQTHERELLGLSPELDDTRPRV